MSTARNGVSPAAARRRLGKDLRDLRAAADMTREDVAAELERSTATMSRLERGTSKPRQADVKALLDLYGERRSGLVDDQTRQALLALALESRKQDWYTAYRDVLGTSLEPSGLRTYVELESDARSYRSLEATLVPGLLQTPAYAAAIAAVYFPDATSAQRQRFVEFRMERQRVIDQLHDLHVVIGEAALRRLGDEPAVMHEQLQRLLADLSDGRTNVEIQIAPVGLTVPAVLRGSFVLMELGDGSSIVYLEGRESATYLRGEDDIARYRAEFDELARQALDRDASRKLVEEVIEDYR